MTSIKYKNLIKQVSQINEEAALYLKNEATTLKSFKESGKIDALFIWEQSKQGHDFWYDIWLKLKK